MEVAEDEVVASSSGCFVEFMESRFAVARSKQRQSRVCVLDFPKTAPSLLLVGFYYGKCDPGW